MVETVTILPLTRALHLAATLSLLGSLGFIAWILPGAPDPLHRRLIGVWWVSGLVALLAGGAWFTLQGATIADASTVSELWAALPLVAEHTRYGTTLMLRLALLLVATLAAVWARRGPDDRRNHFAAPAYFAMVPVTIALALQGFMGHAGATPGGGLVLSESLHLLAAGFWLGALLPLGLSLRVLAPAAATSVCQRFSPIGLACVLVLIGTGLTQALEFIGSLPGLFGTQYGHIALLKIVLFALALALAAINRLWLTDRLATAPATTRRHLLLSISIETVIGLAIVTAAAFLASTVPGAHETPVWPFSWKFSLVTVREDPDFRREIFVSLLCIGTAILLLAAALLWRRFRLSATLVLLIVIVWRGPSFSLLTVEAYPTSFQTSPTGFSATAIAHGQALFVQNCVVCHGFEGDGNGAAAAGLHIKPTDLTQPHFQEHTDGELFWWLTHGIDDPEGGLAMPGFAGVLSAEDRWALIDYLRAHNAAVAMQQDAASEEPTRAPALPIDCNGVAASAMTDLLGHAVLIVLGGPTKPPAAVPADDAITLFVPADSTKPAPGSCVAADPAAWNAYAVLADVPLDEAAGSAFLVDPNGWLRGVQRPGASDLWRSRDDLLATIRTIRAHPIDQPSGGSHAHHH